MPACSLPARIQLEKTPGSESQHFHQVLEFTREAPASDLPAQCLVRNHGPHAPHDVGDVEQPLHPARLMPASSTRRLMSRNRSISLRE